MELYQKSDSLSSNAKYSDFSDLIEFWNKATEKDVSFVLPSKFTDPLVCGVIHGPQAENP